MRKLIGIIVAMGVFMLVSGISVYAQDQSYIYNKYQQPVPSLPGYYAQTSYEEFECGKLNVPEDIYIRDNYCFIADTNNNRIIIYDISNNDFRFIRIIDSFSNNGKQDKFSNPNGVFANAQMELFIADTTNGRIVKLDFEGNFINVFGKPEITVMSNNYEYFPKKIVVDEDYRMYILATGMTEGLMQLNKNGEFIRFYGSNPVRPNMFELLFRNFLTQEQISRRRIFIPQEYSNVTLSNERFIYTSTLGVENEQVKHLNYSGKNIIRMDNLVHNKYGDHTTVPDIVDVGVDKSDNIYTLDQKSGRIYQYNELSDLMFVTGGIGDKQGSFKKATALAVADDGRVFVTDSMKNNITVFKPTEFGALVLKANDLYIEGYFKESRDNWDEIIKRDANYTLAKKSIGSAYLQEKQYYSAMKYFLEGRDFKGYSQAFEKFRTDFLRKNFNIICIIIIIFITLVLVFKKRITRSIDGIVEFVG